MLAVLTLVGGCVFLGACSGSTQAGGTAAPRDTSSASAIFHEVPPLRPVSPYWRSDGDSDADEGKAVPGNDDDLEVFSTAPRKANRTDTRAITTAVKNYFAAAAAHDGAQGCVLLASSLSSALATEGSSRSHAAPTGCGARLTVLFEQQREHLAAEDVSTMVLTRVDVNGSAAIATVGFGAAPGSEIILQREGPHWKIDSLFDSVLP